MQFANAHIDLEDIVSLAHLGKVFLNPDEGDAIYVRFYPQSFSVTDLVCLAEAIHSMHPDELSFSDGVLRLWWD